MDANKAQELMRLFDDAGIPMKYEVDLFGDYTILLPNEDGTEFTPTTDFRTAQFWVTKRMPKKGVTHNGRF